MSSAFSKRLARRSCLLILACQGLWLAAPSAHSQSQPDQLVDASTCIGIEDDARRLACFDRITAHLREREPGAVAAPPANEHAPEDVYPIEATVTGLREREPRKWLITLDNGQIWYQSYSKRFRLREGMEVSISPSPLGNAFRLSSQELQDFIQVDRVR